MRGLRWLLSEYLILGLCLGYFLLMAPTTPGLASGANIRNVLSDMLPLLILAAGQTVVLIGGGIDLSMPSLIAVTSVAGSSLMTSQGGALGGSPLALPVGVAVMLILGLGLGAGNGLAVTALRMPPFIVTLTSMMFLSGFAVWWTQSENIYALPPGFVWLGQNPIGATTLTLLFCLGLQVVLDYSVYGRWLYAVGLNPRAARVSGVPVKRVLTITYVVAGFSAALAAVLLTGRLETGSPVHGREMLLDIIGATVIGGTSLYGGKGKILWTVFGVLFLSLIDNSLNLRNCSHFTIMMVKGGVILSAAVLDSLRNRLLVGE